MAVHHRKARIFLLQMQKDRHQRDVLDHIGEISRMIAVAVIHGQAEICSRARPRVRGPNRPMTIATTPMQPAMKTKTPGAPKTFRIAAIRKALKMLARREKD
jgi:hypothetical protein